MIVLGLGSNLGDRLSYLKNAVEKLESLFSQSLKSSAIYESDPLVLADAQEDWKNLPFLNLAVATETHLEPAALLKRLKEIEQQVGRKHRDRWAPREIDIDILAWNDLHLDSSTLSIPHPALLERPFALLPLAELTPHWKFPVPGENYLKTAETLARAWRENPESIPFHTRKVNNAI